mgnify:CR=1 FL=1
MTSNIIKMISGERALEKYTDRNRLLEEAVPYVGRPRQSESDPEKIFLRLDPLATNGLLLEFQTEDVLLAENVRTVSKKDGTMFQVIRIWIQKGSIGIKLEPFVVEDLSHVLSKDFDI